MAQQAIKIGVKALSDTLDTGNIEIIGDATSLDTTVNAVTGNLEVVRIVIADNVRLSDDLVLQAIETVRRVLTHEQVTRIVQA